MKKLAVPFVLISGTCWAGMTVFIRMLRDLGLNTMDMVLIRCVMTSVLLFLILFVTNREKLRVKRADLPLFILSAAVTVLLFNYCYFRAVNSMSISIAVVLLYISPAFVMLLSAIIFRETITKAKVVSLVMMAVGTVLVTGLVGSELTVTPLGFLLGIGSALFYAMVSIFNPIAIRRGYTGPTITFYTYLFAIAGALLLADVPLAFRTMFGSFSTFLLSCAFAVISTVLPFVLYSTALQYIEPSRAALICSIEPVVGALVSVFVYHEPMTGLMLIGIAIIMAAIVICNLKPQEKKQA